MNGLVSLPPQTCANSWIESCDSTNLICKKLGEEGYPHGTWIAARGQTQGRGRSSRAWISPPGNLYFSYLSRQPELRKQAHLTWLPLVAALATARAVEELSSLKIKIKWPNDLMVDEKKLGGILCEAPAEFEVIGVGVNCFAPPSLPDRETAAAGVDPEVLLPTCIASLSKMFEVLKAGDLGRIKEEYVGRSYFQPGMKLAWRPKGSGSYVGIGNSGELRVRVSDRVCGLFGEEVRLEGTS